MSGNGWVESPRPKIFKASQRPATLLILSPLSSWLAHRIDEQTAEDLGLLATRPVRCIGERCRLCGNFQRIERAVVLVMDTRKVEWFLYLTERNRKVFEKQNTLAGLEIRAWKKGPATNSALEITIEGTHNYRVRDIESVCATFDQAGMAEQNARPELRVVACE